MTTVPSAPPALAVQGSFEDLGRPLHDVTFTVVDLETTGGSPARDAITEIGAVRVRGGEVLGEFQTLVDPGVAVPPQIALLTGITDAMLVGAPHARAAVPAFLDFAAGSVLVAHNAGFDVSFLRAACRRQQRPFPRFEVVDTVLLARRLVTSDEVPNRRLASLARFFRSATTPEHRALADARATVDVLHGLLARARGVSTVEQLLDFCRTDERRRPHRHLADGLPSAPGVYRFLDAGGRVLYVGSSLDIRSRVRSYFTQAERRRRMTEMVSVAARVDHVLCATPLEAQVRELRLLAEHRPPYNRRSTRPEKSAWVVLTDEPAPRLSVVARPRADRAGASYVGLFGSRSLARSAVEAVHAALPLRTCTTRIARRGGGSACVLAELGRCTAPCLTGPDTHYDEVVDAARRALEDDLGPLVEALVARVNRLSDQQRYEEAAAHRDRLAVLVRGLDRAQQVRALVRCGEVVAARPQGTGGWELACVRHGRLAGAATTRRGDPVMPAVEALVATAEHVPAPERPGPAGLTEEATLLVRWLGQPGVRLVRADAGWALPVGAAARWARLHLVEAAGAARTGPRAQQGASLWRVPGDEG
ncbi:DEDD exonuclease domain-containing protein [Aquipuribacter nitratireducens]|uniref:DEDD exonuclease domain-containing protein n=1 Tax=Aquipuribacter nitratireducens TaxID=650104 RepID=A0ABW0GQL4_9MICO